MASLAVVPNRKVSLLNLEDIIECLLNCVDTVTAEDELEFVADCQEAMIQSEGQAAIAKQEIERLRRRAQHFEASVELLEHAIMRRILLREPDRKGKYAKLTGDTFTLAIRRNPPSIAVSDEAMVPARCKSVSVTMPAPMWDDLIDSVDMDFAAEVLAQAKVQVSVGKERIRDAIAEQVPDWQVKLQKQPSVCSGAVPGAVIAAGGWRLVRE